MDRKEIRPNLVAPKGLELKESAIQEGQLGKLYNNNNNKQIFALQCLKIFSAEWFEGSQYQ
jgi:hypothetical protein